MLRRAAAVLFGLCLVLSLFGCDTDCVAGCDDDDSDSTDDDDVSPGDDDDATERLTDEAPAEILTQRSCEPIVRHYPFGTPKLVEVAGEWTDWEPVAMEGPDEDGGWSLQLEALAPGDYGHKFLHDGKWEGDPPAWAYAKWVEGFENRSLRVGNCQLPLLQAVSASASPQGQLDVLVQFARAADGAPLDPASIEVWVRGGSPELAVDTEAGTLAISAGGLDPGKHSVVVRASDTAGRSAENGLLWIPLWVESVPFSWEDALIYFVFTDRFRNGDWTQPQPEPVPDVLESANYQGGDFLGVLDALEDDWFEDLGVNVLWLTPIYSNAPGAWLATDSVHNFSGFHGYWPISASAVEPRLGDFWVDSEDRLHELIDEAHRQGLRVMLDLVLNHVHQDHDYVSAHPEWFGGGCVCGTAGCDWEERRLDCWFTDYLPDIDYRNHELGMLAIDDTLALIRSFDVDAVRVDAAKHMDHVAMRTLRRRLREEVEAPGAASVYVVGETFTGSDGHGAIMEYVSDWELDGQFDFPLFWAIRDAFVHGGSFVALEEAVATGEAAYGDFVMAPFAGNHDVPRLATEIAGNDDGAWGWSEDLLDNGSWEVDQWELIDRIAMTHAFTLTQPGAPLLYYGDEIGRAGSGDPDNRRPMDFPPYLSGNQQQLLSRVRAIGRARTQHAALRRGQRSSLWVDDDLLIYSLATDAGDFAVVAIHKGEGERTESVALGRDDLDGVVLEDALGSGRSFEVKLGSAVLSLGARDFVFLVD